MHNRIAHGLASTLLVVSLGAAQGPTSSGSKDTQTTKPRNTVAVFLGFVVWVSFDPELVGP